MQKQNKFHIRGDKIYYQHSPKSKEVEVTEEAIEAVRDFLINMLGDSESVSYEWKDISLSLQTQDIVSQDADFVLPRKTNRSFLAETQF